MKSLLLSQLIVLEQSVFTRENTLLFGHLVRPFREGSIVAI
jgi:hypothetical protein